jgi:pSer/pThr/pTyr-binding forkhead associated (FHA) protein
MSTGGTSASNGGDLRLEVVSGKATGFAIVVEERLVIGRHSEGPGRLADDPELSRHHAQISRAEDGMYLIEDLASTNGTIVNGARISSPIPLAVGDSIEVGATVIRVAEAPGKPAAPPGVDVRAATVSVDVPPAMRAAPPPPPPPETEPPTEATAPPTEATAPPTEETPPLAEVAAAPEPEPEVEAEPEPEPVAEATETETEPLAEVEEAPEPPPPLAEAPPLPLDEAPEAVDEPELDVEQRAAPRLALQLVFDPHTGELELSLDDASEPIRLALTEGRWQVKPDQSD